MWFKNHLRTDIFQTETLPNSEAKKLKSNADPAAIFGE